MCSVYEYLELRYDVRTRLAGSALFVLWRLLWLGGILYVPCKVLIVATGLPIHTWWLLVVLGTVTTLYTFLGGMKAVIWTAVIQACVMAGGHPDRRRHLDAARRRPRTRGRGGAGLGTHRGPRRLVEL